MLESLREETEGKLQMLLSPRKNGLTCLTSLFEEVRVFKERPNGTFPKPGFLKNPIQFKIKEESVSGMRDFLSSFPCTRRPPTDL